MPNPQPVRQEWEEPDNWETEFDRTFGKIELDTGAHPNYVRKLKDFIENLLTHQTENGYCCACDYDIAKLEDKLHQARSITISEVVGIVEKDMKILEEIISDLNSAAHLNEITKESITRPSRNQLEALSDILTKLKEMQ
jgi:hypothetical protein